MVTYWVRDAIPGAKTRPATPDDLLIRGRGDGTVEVPPHVDVIQLGDDLWVRSTQLRGWAPIPLGHRTIHGAAAIDTQTAVRAEMARTGRPIPVWTDVDAWANRELELAYWDEMDSHPPPDWEQSDQ